MPDSDARALIALAVLAGTTACAHRPVAAPASEAEAACRALVETYAMARDRVDVATVAALFARGAELTFGDNTVRGPSAIAAQMQKRAEGTITRHLMTTSSFKQDGPDQVDGLSYFLVFEEPASNAPDRPIITRGARAVVEYRDVCTRIDDAWKITNRQVRPIFVRPAEAP